MSNKLPAPLASLISRTSLRPSQSHQFTHPRTYLRPNPSCFARPTIHRPRPSQRNPHPHPRSHPYSTSSSSSSSSSSSPYPPSPSRFSSYLNPTTIVIAFIPILTFCLGTWQVRRLRWKLNLIDELEEKLGGAEIRLPRRIRPEAIPEFAYRRVTTTGEFDHAHEILLGPRTREGMLGYHVITPLVRDYDGAGTGGSTILVNRGFVGREKVDQRTRPESLIKGPVTITGMLRSQEMKNMFSPSNDPHRGLWHFPNIEEMANHSGEGVQPVLVDDIFEGNAGEISQKISRGNPVGRPPTIELRNQHATYAVTWYALSAATSVMLWRLLKRPPRRSGGGAFGSQFRT